MQLFMTFRFILCSGFVTCDSLSMEEKRKQLLDFISMVQNMTVSVSVMQSYVVQHLLRNKRLRKLVISGNILTTNFRKITTTTT